LVTRHATIALEHLDRIAGLAATRSIAAFRVLHDAEVLEQRNPGQRATSDANGANGAHGDSDASIFLHWQAWPLSLVPEPICRPH
jgi:hypothetical protein